MLGMCCAWYLYSYRDFLVQPTYFKPNCIAKSWLHLNIHHYDACVTNTRSSRAYVI